MFFLFFLGLVIFRLSLVIDLRLTVNLLFPFRMIVAMTMVGMIAFTTGIVSSDCGTEPDYVWAQREEKATLNVAIGITVGFRTEGVMRQSIFLYPEFGRDDALKVFVLLHRLQGKIRT